MNRIIDSTFTNNGEHGIHIDGQRNAMRHNNATENVGFDLRDDNLNCDTTTWKENTFGSGSQLCIN